MHRQYLATLKTNGQLAASGPFTDDSGALIIYEAATKEGAGRRPPPLHPKGSTRDPRARRGRWIVRAGRSPGSGDPRRPFPTTVAVSGWHFPERASAVAAIQYARSLRVAASVGGIAASEILTG